MRDSKFKMTSCLSTLIYHDNNFKNYYYNQTNNGIENIIYRILSHTFLSIDPHNNLLGKKGKALLLPFYRWQN